MKTTLLFLGFLGAALLLQGCSGSALYTDEEMQWQDSRFMRGKVIATHDVSFDDSMEHLQVLVHGDGWEQAYQLVLAPKSLNIEGSTWMYSGDIVDIYNGKGTGWDDAILTSTHEKHSQNVAPEHRPQLLGIVCRDGEDGCEINKTPQTTIGFGRKMHDANDYRGVEAESKQKIYPQEIPAGLTFGLVDYTSHYAKEGISADYEEPPEEQQQPHEDRCTGFLHRLTLGLHGRCGL